MSVQQIEAAVQAFADVFTRLDVPAAAEMLDEDLEVFDHVPYRFDSKKQFMNFLQGAVSGLASSSFGFRQLSCRVFNDTTGIANASIIEDSGNTDQRAHLRRKLQFRL
jgi:ketosteroid isomerase-like protein